MKKESMKQSEGQLVLDSQLEVSNLYVNCNRGGTVRKSTGTVHCTKGKCIVTYTGIPVLNYGITFIA